MRGPIACISGSWCSWVSRYGLLSVYWIHNYGVVRGATVTRDLCCAEDLGLLGQCLLYRLDFLIDQPEAPLVSSVARPLVYVCCLFIIVSINYWE